MCVAGWERVTYSAGMTIQQSDSAAHGLRASLAGIVVNAVLACVKIATGVLGSSYALIADGIESAADIISSLVVWSGLKVAIKPADKEHPYGHGKAESLAALVVSGALVSAAILIAVQSVHKMLAPDPPAPKWFTLPVLVVVIALKEVLFRYVVKTADSIESTSLRGDAWHHRSDAITSVAAFIGISIALIGGKGYEQGDAWGAMLACLVIGFNGLRLLRVAADELMDRAAPEGQMIAVRGLAAAVPRVKSIEKCLIRKYGLGYVVDIHVEVDGGMTVREGHHIAHEVKDTLIKSELKVVDVLVHIEPAT